MTADRFLIIPMNTSCLARVAASALDYEARIREFCQEEPAHFVEETFY
jgi:hypothetical protein